ncbi:MAG: DUF433 domain-containing protein [Acidobacteria bacterium]|nr:DUF433 domain-containing protein [Acidobacteriota bacterium]
MDYHLWIESNPEVLVGKPVIRGTRISVELILRKLSESMPMDELQQAYPQVPREGILAALAYSAAILATEEILVG